MPAAVHARHVLHVLLRYHLAKDVHRRVFAGALRPQGRRRRFSVGVDTPQVVLRKQGHQTGTASPQQHAAITDVSSVQSKLTSSTLPKWQQSGEDRRGRTEPVFTPRWTSTATSVISSGPP